MRAALAALENSIRVFLLRFVLFCPIALLLLPADSYGVSETTIRQAIAAEKQQLENVYTVSFKPIIVDTHSVHNTTADPTDEMHTADANVLKLITEIKAAFHNVLLAMDDDNSKLTMLLDQQSMAYFESLGLIVEPAMEYRRKRYDQLEAALERLNSEYSGPVVSTAVFHEQEPMPEQAVVVSGIPGFPCYPTVEETFAVANDLVASYPALAQMIDIGNSWEKQNSGGVDGYDLWVMKITNSTTDADFPNKPKLFIHSAMHAREYATAALTLEFARELLTKYATNPDIAWIVDYQEVHILFHMNPDGRKVAETGVLKRKNNNSSICPATPAAHGVDLNRNFRLFWNKGGFPESYTFASGLECAETYRGPAAGSEPETQAVEAYIKGLYLDNRGDGDSDAAPLTTTGLHLDVHSFGNLLLYPYAHTNDGAPNNDELRRVARRLAFFNNYIPQQTPDLYLLDGNSESVSYGELGIAHITFEIGNTFFQPCDYYEELIVPDNIQALIHAAKLSSAPYVVSDAPYFDNYVIKGRENPDVTLGADIVVSALVSDNLYGTLNGVEQPQTIASVEYSVDQHFLEPTAMTVMLNPLQQAIDYALDSPEEKIEIRLQNASGEFPLGDHTVYLRATDSAGNTGAVAARRFKVIASRYLEADIQYSCLNNVCEFDGSASIDTDGDIASYVWDFGDGQTSSEISPIHYYRQSGNFTVTLTVQGEDGEQDTATVDYSFFLSGEAPNPVVNYQCEHLSCTFDATGTSDPDNNIRVQRWKFGDGKSKSGTVVEHSYESAGRYTVTFILVDEDDWRIDTMLNPEVSEPPQEEEQSSSGGSSSISLSELMLILALFAYRIRPGRKLD